MAEQNNPLHFNPSAALLLDEATFTIHVNRRTGVFRLTTNSPETNFIALMDLFAKQISSICMKALGEQSAGNPGFTPPGGANFGGSAPGSAAGGDDGGKPA